LDKVVFHQASYPATTLSKPKKTNTTTAHPHPPMSRFPTIPAPHTAQDVRVLIREIADEAEDGAVTFKTALRAAAKTARISTGNLIGGIQSEKADGHEITYFTPSAALIQIAAKNKTLIALIRDCLDQLLIENPGATDSILIPLLLALFPFDYVGPSRIGVDFSNITHN
jgi:hypothetical protein